MALKWPIELLGAFKACARGALYNLNPPQIPVVACYLWSFLLSKKSSPTSSVTVSQLLFTFLLANGFIPSNIVNQETVAVLWW